MKTGVACAILCATIVVSAQQPPTAPAMVDTPTVRVLTGLTVPEFESEMQLMTLGRVTCFTCHQGDTRPKKQL